MARSQNRSVEPRTSREGSRHKAESVDDDIDRYRPSKDGPRQDRSRDRENPRKRHKADDLSYDRRNDRDDRRGNRDDRRYDRDDYRKDRRNDRDRSNGRAQYEPRDRYNGRERYEPRDRREDRDRRDDRDRYDERDRKRSRRYDSNRDQSPPPSRRGYDHGRLSPRSYDDRSYRNSSPYDRSRPSSRGNQELDEEEKKAARLAKLQAMKNEAGDKGVKKLEGSPLAATKASGPKYGMGFIKASVGAYSGHEEPAKAHDPAEIAKRAAERLAKQKVSSKPSAALRASMAELEAMSTASPSRLAVDDKPAPRKFDKLPDVDPRAADTVWDDDDDLVSDDESKAAARRTAEQRAREAQKSLPPAQARPQTTTAMEIDDDEVDPLDAFMSTLDAPKDTEIDYLKDIRGGKKAARGFNSDDEDTAISAMDKSLDEGHKKKARFWPTVNHSEMNYEDFRKNFYTESTELADITEEQLEILRLELENINVKGTDVPKPIQSFPQGGFGTQILDVIRSLNFDRPTAVQSQALSAIMSGRDTLAVAKTGSGKTMAYLLPMFRHVKDQRPLKNGEGPIALILVPTRELAVQVHASCKPFLSVLGLRAACCYGGAPISENIADLKRGAEILVATTGRLIDLLASNGGRVTNMSRVTYVVMDEADRMFDMGFSKQAPLILQLIRPNKQAVLFSATLPENIEHFALRVLKNPVQITVGGRSVVAEEITQSVEVIPVADKLGRLLHHLGNNHLEENGNRSLIFVDRQEGVDKLHTLLLKKGYLVASIHGGRDQNDRDQFISEFKRGIIDVLVATSLAARGLDVKQLTLVVNYDCPNHHEDYVHRCGRTGRAGNKGTAVTFITPDELRYAPFLVKALTESNTAVPSALQELADKFARKVKAGEEKEHTSGFGGHGLAKVQAGRDMEKALIAKKYGLDGEELKPEDIQKIEKEDKKKPAESAATEEEDKSERAAFEKLLREAMVVRKTEAMEHAPKQHGSQHGPFKPAQGGFKPGMTALQRAAAAAAAVKGNLATAKESSHQIDARGLDAGVYHAILVVNELPQSARWCCTQRQNVIRVLEATHVSITTKGQYYEPGKEPKEGEPAKMYQLVEGDTSTAVETAMHQLCELAREGLRRHEADQAAKPTTGRYSVV